MEVGDHKYMNGHGTSFVASAGTLSGPPPAPYSEVESSFKVHSFQEEILGQNTAFEVLKMNSSLYVWIGPASNKSLDNMCYSLPTRFSPVPLTSTWFGESDATSLLSQKLSTKLKKPVILSFNVTNSRATSNIEGALFEDIKNNPAAY